jgi:hydroxycarboxylate dehydrogenase B
MRQIAASRLTEIVAAIMQAAGCGADEARTIARRLVDSNLVGHDSHGVLRVSKYLEWMREGNLRPKRTPRVVFESETLAIVDGDRGFGQVIGEFAGRLGIAKAAATGIALVGLRNCGHLGRLGDWAELAADADQVSLHFLNTSGAQRVAPFGGSDRRLSTNPLCVGIPQAGAPPVILDITTSTVAEGKLMVAMNKGESVPPGWIVNAQGQPTTDPKEFYDGGALLTIGGHKGSGLSIVTDLLAGALTTGRSSDPADTAIRNNMLSIYIAPAVYDPGGGVLEEVRRFVDWVKASPPAVPGQPVMAPGDVERATRERRLREGVPLDDTTLADLRAAARSVGIADERLRDIA